MNEQIIQALLARYATDSFDAERRVSDDDLHTILESGRLAPSSFGLEPWHFIVVDNPDIRAKLRAVAWNQKKATDAARLIVIARRTDTRETIASDVVVRTANTRDLSPDALNGYEKMVSESIAGRTDEQLDDWHARQTYIPLGMMTETASLLGINSTAMEGFDTAAVDDILELRARNLASTTMLALGYARQDDERASWKKVRRAFDDVVSFVK